MKEIVDVKELKIDEKVISMCGDEVRFYRFYGVHPHNETYVLMIDELSQNALKFYIPTIIGDSDTTWYHDYTLSDICKKRIEYHQREILRISKQLKEYENNKK